MAKNLLTGETIENPVSLTLKPLPPQGSVVSPIQQNSITPTTPQTSNSSTPQGLDPVAYTLTKAIGLQESGGNYNAVGKSSEYGAYQNIPATWAARSTAAGINVPLNQATPEQQNEVMYKWVDSKLKAGYTPAQIASMQNAGDGAPDAYKGNSGTNSYGVKYDTSAYVQGVQKHAEQLYASQAPQTATGATQTDQTQQSPSLGGFGSNLVKSGANFLGGLGEAVLHPLQTAQNIGGAAVGGLQELGGQTNDNTAKFDALKNYFIERYKSPDALLHTAYTDPVGLAADISTLFGVGGGALGLASKGAKIAGLADAAEATGSVASKLGRVSELTNPLTPVIKGTGALVKAGSGTAKDLASQFTEISPQGMQDIFDNPSAYTPEAIANTSRFNIAKQVETALDVKIAEKSETGSAYEPFKQGVSDSTGVSMGGKNIVPVTHDFLENQLRNVAKLDVKDGKIIPTTVSKVSKSELSKLQEIFDTYKPAFQSGQLTPEEFLTLRGKLAKAAYSDSGIKNTDVAKIADDMRDNLNTTYRPSIPGLESLDADFSAQVKELQKLRKGFIDKEGNLTQAAIAKIANAGNKDLDLARLEQLVPGITRQLTALKVMEEIKNAAGIKVGTYTKSITEGGGALLGLSTGNIPMLAGALTVALISSPKVVVPLIRFLGENKELIPAVMANLAKYATGGSTLSRATSQTEAQAPQTPQDTQTTLPNEGLSTDSNLSSVSSDLNSLATSKGFDLQAARSAGYSDSDIETFLQNN